MNTKRIKEIQAGTAYPNSRSVCSALMQVWNECCHEQAPADTGILALDRHCTDETAAPVEDEPRNGDGRHTMCDHGVPYGKWCPVCKSTHMYSRKKHQHETAPAESGIHADGLTGEGEIPNTTGGQDDD